MFLVRYVRFVPAIRVCVGDVFSTGCRAYVRIARFSHAPLSAHALHSSLFRTRLSGHAPHSSLPRTHLRIVCEGRIFMISTYARIFSFIQGFFELKNRSAMMVSWWSKDHQKLSTGGLFISHLWRVSHHTKGNTMYLDTGTMIAIMIALTVSTTLFITTAVANARLARQNQWLAQRNRDLRK